MTDIYDLVIVGGGINGAGILREAALHGLKCLLIEKKDFTSQTSQASSKMLHGGIRYLETYDFELVAESLHEKNLWLKLAPHLCQERPFVLPLYADSKRPPWMMKTGLFLYDLLSGFHNTPHQMIGREEVLKTHPQLKKEGLRGAGIYYDAVVDDAKLTLEVIYDALVEAHSEAKNYTELIQVKEEADHLTLTTQDTLTHERAEVKTRYLTYATGPFTDQLLTRILGADRWSAKLLPSKGSHLWLEASSLKLPGPMVLTPADGRVIFVIPQKGAILVGTTEIPLMDQDFFDLEASENEIDYLLKNLKETFPLANIGHENILSSFSGVRPLVREEGAENAGKTARTHRCFWPSHRQGVILGGKYTTFRVMAQDLLAPIMKQMQRSFDPDRSKRPLRRPSVIHPFKRVVFERNHLEEILKTEHVRTLDDLVKRRLGVPHPKHWQQAGSLEDFLSRHQDLTKTLSK